MTTEARRDDPVLGCERHPADTKMKTGNNREKPRAGIGRGKRIDTLLKGLGTRSNDAF